MESTPISRVTPLREPDLDRVPQPPSNTEAEQALLGAILINNTAYGRVAEFLAAEHFGNAVHGRIYAAIGKLLDRGQIANPITLKNLFAQDGAREEERVGGGESVAGGRWGRRRDGCGGGWGGWGGGGVLLAGSGGGAA